MVVIDYADGKCTKCCIEQLRAEIAQLKGERPIPDAWWKDCPGVAQRTIERIIDKNEQLQAELDKYRWIPVSERLPKNANAVLLVWRNYFYIGCCRGGKFYIAGELYTEVTHWKPIILPEQAKKGGG